MQILPYSISSGICLLAPILFMTLSSIFEYLICCQISTWLKKNLPFTHISWIQFVSYTFKRNVTFVYLSLDSKSLISKCVKIVVLQQCFLFLSNDLLILIMDGIAVLCFTKFFFVIWNLHFRCFFAVR